MDEFYESSSGSFGTSSKGSGRSFKSRASAESEEGWGSAGSDVLPHSLTSTELERTTTKGVGRKQMPKGEENKVGELVNGH